MKKFMMSIATALFVLCIVPIATTQAMPRWTQGQDSLASGRPNADLSVFNQRKSNGMELNNPVLQNNIHAYDLEEPHETTLAQSGTSTTTTTTGKANPHVKRRGHGRSKMGDNATKKDGEDAGNEENEPFGDDSAVKYNKDLKNTSGYNKDL